jgi:hypothetical protein
MGRDPLKRVTTNRIAMQITFNSKDFFFDRAKIQEAIRAAGQDPKRLNQAGALVRREARSSMRVVKKRTTKSKPGQAPRAHTAEQGLRRIYYAWDPGLRTQVVGSVGFGRRPPVPGIHEHGGTARVKTRITIVKKRVRTGRKATRKQKAALKKMTQQRKFFGATQAKTRTKMTFVTYPQRPFMQPALARISPKLPELWAGSVTDRSVSLT